MNSFKRILALSLTVLMLSSLAACQMFKSEKEKETTTLSLEDMLTATGEKASVTDYDGNVITDDAKSEIDAFNNKEEVLSQEGVKTTKSSKTTKKGETTKKGQTTKKNATTKKSGGESATLPNASYFNTLNQEIFSKGIFTIEGTMSATFEGETMSLPFKLARNGEEQYIHTEYTYQSITIGMLINNTKTYLLIPALKSYQEMDESIFGDSDYSGLTDVKTYGTTKRVQIGDEIYVCEEIKGSDGYSTYFYFDEDTGDLSRIKFEDQDGTSLLKVKSIKPTVNKSEFAIPKGYKKLQAEDFTM